MEILWEEEGLQFGFKIWQGWALTKVLWKWIPNVWSKAREGVKAMSLVFVLLDFQHVGVSSQKKSTVYKTECRLAAVQRGKQDQNHL